jgi:hypothetical protein
VEKVKAYDQAIRCLELASEARDAVSAEELVNLAWLYASLAAQAEAAEQGRSTPDPVAKAIA